MNEDIVITHRLKKKRKKPISNKKVKKTYVIPMNIEGPSPYQQDLLKPLRKQLKEEHEMMGNNVIMVNGDAKMTRGKRREIKY